NGAVEHVLAIETVGGRELGRIRRARLLGGVERAPAAVRGAVARLVEIELVAGDAQAHGGREIRRRLEIEATESGVLLVGRRNEIEQVVAAEILREAARKDARNTPGRREVGHLLLRVREEETRAPVDALIRRSRLQANLLDEVLLLDGLPGPRVGRILVSVSTKRATRAQ